ncbi:HD-GYP domain-containing protein [Deinococcus planocerae]|uniref:HD-GYP domain-containing protein n=1 Tax=Deinococcus planocerae TaxID=1737569 RepID=UPI000C7EB418|nr:HD domain-containing phosphohydrolase [Deinococcus planocerae]
MFRRPPRPQTAPEPDLRPAVAAEGPTPAETPDATRVLADLLARPTAEGILEGALAHGASLLGGGVQGYGVLRRGEDRVTAVLGYPKTLVGTVLSGPWTGPRPRVLAGGGRDLYEQNPPEVHARLDECGLKDALWTLVVPLADRGRTLGALVFDGRVAGEVAPAAQEAVSRWAGAVAPLLSLLGSRDDWRQASRQLSVALVEAVESREFDSLGHAQAVAETALRLGRAVGLAGRELEELWFAATLHDLGKINGEAGHAQVGANFLHGVPQLAESQKAIRHHHERWDGGGEPNGLSGEDIPLYARILAVANASVRLGDPERVRAQAGVTLDPRLVTVLEQLPQ